MGRTSQEDELDDLRADLAEDPELADTFARLDAGKDSRRERRSGSEFGNPLQGFVPVPSVPSERAVSSRSGLPSFHADDDGPPDTPTRRYVKSEHADPSLGEPPPSTHRTGAPPGARDAKRGPLPKPMPPPARASAPGPMSAQRGKPSALVYGPVSSPNGAPSAPDPLVPVNSGPVISVRNTAISMPPDEYGSRVTPVVGAPPTPASPTYPTTPNSTPTIDSGFELQPLADSVESERAPEMAEPQARAVALQAPAPAPAPDEREGSGARLWFLIAATLLSAAATVVVLMFVVRPFSAQSSAPRPGADTAAAPATKPQATAPIATAAPPPIPTAPAVTAAPAATVTAAPAEAETVQPPASAIAATPPGAVPTPGQGGFVPQFTKQPTGTLPQTGRPPATAKPTTSTTAAPKSTVSPIFEFEK